MSNFKDNYNVKGVKHVFLPDIFFWQYVEKEFKSLMNVYCYNEIKLPIIEKTFLFSGCLGHNSDIIKKEMFSFKDNNERNLTLLPEGTSSCLKSLSFEGSLRNFQKQNVWYFSPMFRKENPQKGRNRLFYQIGIESFGSKSFRIDLEHVIIINKLFKILKINNIVLEINYIDNSKNSRYKKILNSYIKNKNISNFKQGDFSFNSLIVLDKIDKIVFNDVPASIDYLNNNKKSVFIKILYFLKILNIFFVVNKFLVRGLEYYNDLVYEWTTNIDNRELTICAGGRYDNLSKRFGEFTYATGCAFGLERVILSLKNNLKKKNHLLILFENNIPILNIIFLKEFIINEFKHLNINVDFIKSSFDQKIKKIKKKGVSFILFINRIKIKEKKAIFIFQKKYKIVHFSKLSRYIWKEKLNF